VGKENRRVTRYSPTTKKTCTTRWLRVATDELAKALTIGWQKPSANARTDELKGEVQARLAETYEGPRKKRSSARVPLADQESWSGSASSPTTSASTVAASPTSGRAVGGGRRGSACATGARCSSRGETQILGVTTLDMVKMAQQIDSLGPENVQAVHASLQTSRRSRPARPAAVGSPKRREIGAWRAGRGAPPDSGAAQRRGNSRTPSGRCRKL